MNRDFSPDRVVFLHIPKTAGSTLYRILETHYRWESIYTMWQDGTLDEFKALSTEQKMAIRLLRGHFGFGIRTLLPGPSEYFTILRDPTERVISYYHFVRRSPRHYCYERVTKDNMSLETFVTSRIDTLLDNGQTRLLANRESGHEIPFGSCTTALLDEAKHNLREQMKVVGLTERFDETLFLLQQAFGWRKLYYSRQNVSAGRSSQQALPPSTLATIQATNTLDTELYHFAEMLFEEQLAQFGDELPQRLADFRRANQRRQRLTHLLWELRKYPVRTYLRRLIGWERP